METTLTKTKSFIPVGIYKTTAIDIKKQTVDFRIIDVSGKGKNYATIIWNKDNKIQNLTKRELKKLQEEYTWHTDF